MAVSLRGAQHLRMLRLSRIIGALAGRLRGPRLTPEEHLRRHADRLEAEDAMRRGIERASRMFGRTNRFVR